jgi:hypothetical protein
VDPPGRVPGCSSACAEAAAAPASPTHAGPLPALSSPRLPRSSAKEALGEGGAVDALVACARLFATPGAADAAAAEAGAVPGDAASGLLAPPALSAPAAAADALRCLRSLCGGHAANCRRLAEAGGQDAAEQALLLAAAPGEPGGAEAACLEEGCALLAELAAPRGGPPAPGAARACEALLGALRRW